MSCTSIVQCACTCKRTCTVQAHARRWFQDLFCSIRLRRPTSLSYCISMRPTYLSNRISINAMSSSFSCSWSSCVRLSHTDLSLELSIRLLRRFFLCSCLLPRFRLLLWRRLPTSESESVWSPSDVLLQLLLDSRVRLRLSRRFLLLGVCLGIVDAGGAPCLTDQSRCSCGSASGGVVC